MIELTIEPHRNKVMGKIIENLPVCYRQILFQFVHINSNEIKSHLSGSTITACTADVNEPEPRTCVSIDEWIDVWGHLVGDAKKMDDFPMWLQYYPKCLFDVINRSGKPKNNKQSSPTSQVK